LPKLPDVIVPESSWYQAEETSQLLGAAPDNRVRTMLLFALHTGVAE
jgi:hypothetical protein